tara:strand:- start:53 stop:238 length:186 start_codon:yes stop_codon:yes gene_type:complete
MMEEDEAKEVLVPVQTCYIVCRDIPVDIKDQLVRIRRKRGWSSWKDMVLEVVKLLGEHDDV